MSKLLSGLSRAASPFRRPQFVLLGLALLFFILTLLDGSAAPRQQPPFAGSGDAQSGDPVDPAALPYVLERLARVAELYEGQALSFIALEEIRDRQAGKTNWMWRRERSFDYEYIYGTVDEEDAERAGDILPGVYMDYRRRAGSKDEELAPDEVVKKHQLAALVSRGFSFPVGLRRSVQDLHRYEIVAQEEMFDRPALVVSIEPVPPCRLGLNNWFGRAWIDSETYLPLKFELFEPEDFAERSKLLAAERGEGVEGEYTFTTMTALFEIVHNGMRFPSQITQERKMVNLQGLRSGRERIESNVFFVTQTYSDYRFFNIRTEEEIHELIFGGTTRARIKKE